VRPSAPNPWAFGLLLAAGALAQGGAADPRKAIAALKGLGGEVRTEAAAAGGAVVAVDLGGCAVTDADLAPLRALTGLQTLDL
jgi:hypothetical protein